jgi:hypothetical protein
MTIGSALKITLGIVCFGLGAAGLMVATGMVFFVSATDAAIPATFLTVGAILLWIAFLLLRQVRWHND